MLATAELHRQGVIELVVGDLQVLGSHRQGNGGVVGAVEKKLGLLLRELDCDDIAGSYALEDRCGFVEILNIAGPLSESLRGVDVPAGEPNVMIHLVLSRTRTRVPFTHFETSWRFFFAKRVDAVET